MTREITWGGKQITPEPLGAWEWRKPRKIKNKGGGMKKLRGRKHKGRNTHRPNTYGPFCVASFELATGVSRPSEMYVFRYIRDTPHDVSKSSKKPRCYSYPPRKGNVRI